MLRTRGKSGARVDHKSVRLDAWLIVWARALAMGFGALIERLLLGRELINEQLWPGR